MAEKSLILTHQQINQKIKRIAFEIYENNFLEKEIILAGIHQQGYSFANLLKDELGKIAPFTIKLVGITLDKQAPTQSSITLDCDEGQLKNKAIILIDDVSNTGKTMAYSLKPFLNLKIKKIETAVLVNRSHPNFPISIQYSGYELATTIKDHVEVQLLGKKKAVYLL
ncbi:MAG TPA: phosphoribosyltransferase family protein [Fulvivirga sp.]|nr:phosphoribosyltransferase family protein [Fulvivirga sp.]